MWDTTSTQTLTAALTYNRNEQRIRSSQLRRVRLVYRDGFGHEVVRPLLLDTEYGMLYIAGGEARELDNIDKIEAI